MPKSVAVFGAGPAGLTAAHELRCRGYDVTVYEKNGERAVGGKARTQYWTLDDGTELQGEHGFRFFPAFYQLIDDTMNRIPLDPATEDHQHAIGCLVHTPYRSMYTKFSIRRRLPDARLF